MHSIRQDATAVPNVIAQVLPFDTGAHASMGTWFELLQFPEPGDTAIVYIEDQTSSSRPVIAVRDSKDPNGPVLAFSTAEWRELTSRIKAGDFIPT